MLFSVWGSDFKIESLGFGAYIWSSGRFRVQGLGCRVRDSSRKEPRGKRLGVCVVLVVGPPSAPGTGESYRPVYFGFPH